MKTQEIIDQFNLTDEVSAFVRSKAKALATNRVAWGFDGSNKSAFCKNSAPHIPHVTGGYSTVRHGWATEFCTGVEGAVEGGNLHIVIESAHRGSAESFADASGFYFITPEGGTNA